VDHHARTPLAAGRLVCNPERVRGHFESGADVVRQQGLTNYPTGACPLVIAKRPKADGLPILAADGLAEALVAQRQFLSGRFSSVRQPAGSGVDCGPTE
jgi:hypothetical protein